LRAASYLINADAIENDISFRLSRGYLPVAADLGTLYYADLAPSTDYTLTVMRAENAPEGVDLVQHFELAVEPVSYITDYVMKKALPLSACRPYTNTGTT
jgi:hypothetical protein